jgi:hypothetical protein
VTYPPWKLGRYFEEYFHDFWQETAFQGKENFVHIDVFWQHVFHLHGMQMAVGCLLPAIQDVCRKAQEMGRIPFTVCQWDDGPGLGSAKPANLVVFSLGQSKDVPLPLIAEDTDNKLLSVPRMPVHEERTTLCSFVGTITHELRDRMCEVLSNCEGFVIHTAREWHIQVPEDRAQLFVQTTQRNKFALAPRGYGASSFRFWEILQLGVVPIYVHDGDDARPFTDVLDYDTFSVTVHIDELSDLPARLRSMPDDVYAAMLKAGTEVITRDFTMMGTCLHIVRILRQAHAEQQTSKAGHHQQQTGTCN